MPSDRGRDLRDHARNAPRYSSELEHTDITKMHREMLARQRGKEDPRRMQEPQFHKVPWCRNMIVECAYFTKQNPPRAVVHIVAPGINPEQLQQLIKRHFEMNDFKPEISYDEGVDLSTGSMTREKGCHTVMWEGKLPPYIIDWIKRKFRQLDEIVGRNRR
jgi:hypothetical protein